jgi:hypothetical protein
MGRWTLEASPVGKADIFCLRYIYYYYLIELKIVALPGGSGTAMRRNTQKSRYHSKKTQHTKLHKQ